MHSLFHWFLSLFHSRSAPTPEKIRPALAPDLEIIGNMAAETWPRYRENWADIVIETIRRCDFNLERYPFGRGDDKIIRFIVGDFTRSRKLAVHPDDPPGLVYILEDDGGDWTTDSLTNFKPVKVVKVVTLGELIGDGYLSVERHLELDQYQNQRLWDGMVRRGKITVQTPIAEA